MLSSAMQIFHKRMRYFLGIPDSEHLASIEKRLAELEAHTMQNSLSTPLADADANAAKLDKKMQLLERYVTRGFWHALDVAYIPVLDTKKLTCIICGHFSGREGFGVLSAECFFGGGMLERYHCPTCGCIFGSQKFLDLPADLVDLDYQMLYSRYREAETGASEMRAFDMLEFSKDDGTVLNWGAGAWNDTTQALRRQGYEAWSFEPSAPATDDFVISERKDLPAQVGAIFSNNVIEHFLEPVQQFRDFHSMLKPGGKMAHASPCYEYLYPITRFHTVFLAGRSAEILAEKTGFKVVARVDDGEFKCVIFEKV